MTLHWEGFVKKWHKKGIRVLPPPSLTHFGEVDITCSTCYGVFSLLCSSKRTCWSKKDLSHRFHLFDMLVLLAEYGCMGTHRCSWHLCLASIQNRSTVFFCFTLWLFNLLSLFYDLSTNFMKVFENKIMYSQYESCFYSYVSRTYIRKL